MQLQAPHLAFQGFRNESPKSAARGGGVQLQAVGARAGLARVPSRRPLHRPRHGAGDTPQLGVHPQRGGAAARGDGGVRGGGAQGRQREKVGNWTQGEKRGRETR
eukprot:2351975-Pyramimonas_sp.AAC.1